MKRILVIDDDLETCNFLTEIFAEEGWEVISSQSAEAARETVEKTHCDLIVSDINLGGRTTGVALLKEFRAVSPDSEVILISGFGTLETAVEAVREGAFDYISKPFNVNEVIATARRALKGRDAGAPAAVLLKEYSEASGLVGHSHKMIELYKEIALVAATGIRQDELRTLAEIGALTSVGGAQTRAGGTVDRRTALWQAERAGRPSGQTETGSPAR